MKNKKNNKSVVKLVSLLAFVLFGLSSCDMIDSVIQGVGGNKSPTEEGEIYTGKISSVSYKCGEDDVTFFWVNPTDEQFCGVKVYQGDELYETTEKDQTSVKIEDLVKGESYSFTFRACATDSKGKEIDSVNCVQKRVKITPVEEEIYTGKISELSYECGEDDVTFFWINPTDEQFCGVKVYQGDELYATTKKNQTSVKVEALVNGETYSFTFRACATDSKGKEIDSVNCIQQRVKITPVEEEIYTGKISELSYECGEEDVTFFWVNPTDEQFCGVKVYQGDELYATTKKNQTSVKVEALVNGETYSFTFRACAADSKGKEIDSVNCIQQRVKITPVDKNLYFGELSNVQSFASDDSVTFTWEIPADDKFTGVAVYVDGNLRDEVGKDTTKYTFRNLEIGTYTFTLKAKGRNGNGKIVETENPVTKKVDVVCYTKYGYVGRGYNAISGEFFCATSGLKDKILQFNDNFKPSVDVNVNASGVMFSAGKTASEYQKEFTQAVGVSGGYLGFSASVDVNFGSKESFTEETSFASANSMNKKEREYLTASMRDLESLKANLTEDFKDAVNDPSVSPETLFDDYGTHVMLDTHVGGRFAVNYTYENKHGEEAKSIEVAVKANYEGAFKVGGSSNTNFGSNSSMSKENTTITGYSRGGKSIAFASIEEAVECWKDWTASLDDPGTWSLVDSQDTIKNENKNTGVWLLADDEARRNEIKAKYDELVANNGGKFDSMNAGKWVKAVYVINTGKNASSYSAVRNEARHLLGHNNFMVAGEEAAENADNICNFDLLKGRGSDYDYIYLIVEYTSNKDEAIRGVIGTFSISKAYVDKYESLGYKDQLYYRAKSPEFFCPNIDPSNWYAKDNLQIGGTDSKLYSEDGEFARAIYQSKTQNRNGTTGEKAYPIREVAIYNKTANKLSATTKARTRWVQEPDDGNCITSYTDIICGSPNQTFNGNDEIYFRVYYDPNDIK